MKVNLNKKAIVLMGLALTSGLIAAFCAQQYISEKVLKIEEASRVTTVQRIVAAYDLPEGTQIHADHVAIRDIPQEWAGSTSLTPAEFNSIDGLYLNAPLKKGEMLTQSLLQKPHNKPFSDRIAYGRRALTMPVDTINSVSGMLVAGDLIDLYVSFEYMKKKITAPLLQGVLVLATGNQSSGYVNDVEDGGHHYSTVTLDISPEEAARMVSARQSGTITALLRNPDDKKATQKGVRGNLAKILGISQPPPTQRTKPVVVYGNAGHPRSFSASNSSAPKKVEEPDMGMFDLPGQEDIVSAWIRSKPPVAQQSDDIHIAGGPIAQHFDEGAAEAALAPESEYDQALQGSEAPENTGL